MTNYFKKIKSNIVFIKGYFLYQQLKTDPNKCIDENYESVYIYFKKARELNTNNYSLLYMWGNILAHQAKSHCDDIKSEFLYKQAFQKFKESLEIRPKQIMVLYSWGYNLFQQALRKNGAEAEVILIQAGDKLAESLKINKNYYKSIYCWGNILTEQALLHSKPEEIKDILKQAIEKYQIASQVKPKEIDILLSLGNALFQLAQMEEGRNAEELFGSIYSKYQQALQIKCNAETLYNWGSVLAYQATTQNGEQVEETFKLAYQKFEEALNLTPKLTSALFNWGFALEDHAKMKNDKDSDTLFNQAYQKYQRILDINPNDYKVLSRWGITLIEQAKKKVLSSAEPLYKKAKEKLLEAEKLDPKNGAYLLGYHSLIQGNEDECIQWLKKSLDIGGLEILNFLKDDPHFESVREKSWFTKMINEYENNVKE